MRAGNDSNTKNGEKRREMYLKSMKWKGKAHQKYLSEILKAEGVGCLLRNEVKGVSRIISKIGTALEGAHLKKGVYE